MFSLTTTIEPRSCLLPEIRDPDVNSMTNLLAFSLVQLMRVEDSGSHFSLRIIEKPKSG